MEQPPSVTPPGEMLHGAPGTPPLPTAELPPQPGSFSIETPPEPERSNIMHTVRGIGGAARRGYYRAGALIGELQAAGNDPRAEQSRLGRVIGAAKVVGSVAALGVVAYNMRHGGDAQPSHIGGGHEYTLTADTTPIPHPGGTETQATYARDALIGTGVVIAAGTVVGKSISKFGRMKRYRQAAAARVAPGGSAEVHRQRALDANNALLARQARFDPTASGRTAYGGRRTGQPNLYPVPDPYNPGKKMPNRPGWSNAAAGLPSSTYVPAEKVFPINRSTPSWFRAFFDTSSKEPRHPTDYAGQRNKHRWYHRGP